LIKQAIVKLISERTGRSVTTDKIRLTYTPSKYDMRDQREYVAESFSAIVELSLADREQ
jgi:hypothetical protein